MGALHRLTALKAKNLTAPGRHADGGGLYLAIKSHGKIKGRSWVFLYRCRASGRLRELGLGSANVVSLQAARQSAASARSMLAAGIDPLADKKAKLAALKGARTFGDFTNEFLETALAGFKNEKHRAQWRSTLENDAAALWPMMLPAITTADVVAVLQPIWNTKPETAKRLRGRIERVLSAAKAANLREGDNPARWTDNLQPLLGKQHRVAKHHAALPYAEAPSFMAKLCQHHSISATALEFCILTASRTNEVIGARWNEVDLGRKLWTIPGERMKMKRPHEVPLSDRAVEILKSLGGERTGHVFKGAKRGQGLSNMALLECLRGLRDDVTTHGFRSSFRDWAGDKTSFPRDVVEAALAHKIKDPTEAAYRRGTALDKRRELMTAWASYLAR